MENSIPTFDPGVIEALRELENEDNPGFVRQLIQLYLDNAPERIATLRSALISADSKKIFSEAHTLKSSSASLGGLQLSHLCESLETLARSGSTQGAGEWISRIEAEFASFSAVLRQIT